MLWIVVGRCRASDVPSRPPTGSLVLLSELFRTKAPVPCTHAPAEKIVETGISCRRRTRLTWSFLVSEGALNTHALRHQPLKVKMVPGERGGFTFALFRTNRPTHSDTFHVTIQRLFNGRCQAYRCYVKGAGPSKAAAAVRYGSRLLLKDHQFGRLSIPPVSGVPARLAEEGRGASIVKRSKDESR